MLVASCQLLVEGGRMRVKDPFTEGEEPINLVPLTDMVFNLLIFFMCATTFAQVEKELGVQLPRTSAFVPMSAPPRQVIVNIEENGALKVAGETLDPDGLSTLLKTTLAREPDTGVVVRADERSQMKYFAAVTRACKAAGVPEAKIVYLEEAASP